MIINKSNDNKLICIDPFSFLPWESITNSITDLKLNLQIELKDSQRNCFILSKFKTEIF